MGGSFNTDHLETEIIRSTISNLTPDTSEIRLIVPAESGEWANQLDAREAAFYIEHNRIKKDSITYFLLSSNLTIPDENERYVCQFGLPNSFSNFLFHEAKNRLVNCSVIKNLNGINLSEKTLNSKEFNTNNMPGCYGYIEYSRMQFSENHTKAQFIYKYRLNHGMNITQFVVVKKKKKTWQIESIEEILISYESANTPIEPTMIIDTLIAPKCDDDNFQIKFSSDIKDVNSLPQNEEIIVTMKQNCFDNNFLKHINLQLSVDRSLNDLSNIDFFKINDSTYNLKIKNEYKEPFIEFSFEITPKRGYIYSDFLEPSQSTRYVDHLGPATLKSEWKLVKQLDGSVKKEYEHSMFKPTN